MVGLSTLLPATARGGVVGVASIALRPVADLVLGVWRGCFGCDGVVRAMLVRGRALFWEFSWPVVFCGRLLHHSDRICCLSAIVVSHLFVDRVILASSDVRFPYFHIRRSFVSRIPVD